jgi:hypothetical protein
MNEPFYFRSQVELVRILGLKAKNPVEMMEGLKTIPPLCIYYHTHKFLQQHRFLSPEPPNDFAHWLGNILNLRELGEEMASVDVVNRKNMEELRTEFIRILDSYISQGKYTVDAHDGAEFHFMSCRVFVLPTRYTARTPGEFIEAVRVIGPRSLYFHVFEAKMRLEGEENDFAAWFRGLGEVETAKALSKLDPYTITLEGLRSKIIETVVKYAES